jgi:outer membrane immunogenic protein
MRTRILIAACATAWMTGASFAADLDIAPQPYRAPVRPMTYDWTGLYFGVNVGYGWASGTSSTGFTGGVLNGITVTNTADLGGGLVGAQAGFNWQAGWVVFGIELDGDWAAHQQTVTAACGIACTMTDTVKIRGLVTGRGRVGVAFDRVLAYVTAGAAFISASDDLTVTLGGVTGNFLTISNSKLGWTAGVGVEAAFWGNWSARAEYLYVDVDGPTSNGGVANVFVIVPPNPLAGGTVTETWRFRENLVRLAANYRFGP